LACTACKCHVTGLLAPPKHQRHPRRPAPLRAGWNDLYGPSSTTSAPADAATAPTDDPLVPKELPEGAVGVDMFGTPVDSDGVPLDAAGAPAPPAEENVLEEYPALAALERETAPLAEDSDMAAAVAPAPPAKTYPASDFFGSEWKIGVLWRDKKAIDVTWVRCREDGTAEFGWGAEGRWKLDDGCFLTFTRDFPLGWNGKRLFSARVGEDPNFVEGVVRGWKPFESASVMGQWQGIRLGVKDRGVAPWMEE